MQTRLEVRHRGMRTKEESHIYIFMFMGFLLGARAFLPQASGGSRVCISGHRNGTLTASNSVEGIAQASDCVCVHGVKIHPFLWPLVWVCILALLMAGRHVRENAGHHPYIEWRLGYDARSRTNAVPKTKKKEKRVASTAFAVENGR